MSYNVFVALSERYWTGYPTSENPCESGEQLGQCQVHLDPD